MEFHAHLKELRRQKGETQKMLGEIIGVSWKQIQRFEYGEQKPGFDNLWKLADHFQVSVDDLMGRTEATGLPLEKSTNRVISEPPGASGAGPAAFGDRLKELRRAAGETQPVLAKAVGVSTGQIVRFEKGEQKPGLDNLWKLADHFQVTMDYLAGRTDENKI